MGSYRLRRPGPTRAVPAFPTGSGEPRAFPFWGEIKRQKKGRRGGKVPAAPVLPRRPRRAAGRRRPRGGGVAQRSRGLSGAGRGPGPRPGPVAALPGAWAGPVGPACPPCPAGGWHRAGAGAWRPHGAQAPFRGRGGGWRLLRWPGPASWAKLGGSGQPPAPSAWLPPLMGTHFASRALKLFPMQAAQRSAGCRAMPSCLLAAAGDGQGTKRL